MRLQSYLAVLILAAVVPVVVFSAGVFVFHEWQERADVERRLQETVRTLSATVDRELAMSITALETLATAQSLETGNVDRFYERARRVARAHAEWSTLALYDAAGQRVFTTAQPLERRPAARPAPTRDSISTGTPTVSDLLEPEKVVAVRVPVLRGDHVAWTLAASIRPDGLATVLSRWIPSGWVAALIGRDKIVIARTRGLDRYVGQPTVPRVAAESAQTEEGAYRDFSMEGVSVHIAHARSRVSGWTVAMAIPTTMLESPLYRILGIIGSHALIFGLLSVVLAMLVARGLGRPLHALRVAAGALGRGIPVPPGERSAIHEMNELREAIEDASALLERHVVRRTTQYAVSQALAASRDRDEGVTGSLRAVCETLNWDRGDLWVVDASEQLEHVGTWRLPWASLEADATGMPAVATPCAELAHEVWASGEPRWGHEGDAPAVPDGAGGIAVPITGGAEVLGVLTFHARRIGPRDEELLRMLVNIGGHIGQFLQRERAECERAEMLAREQAARAEAEAANRVKDEFLATLSHELRTPLQSMLGWIEVLRSGRAGSETASRALETIARNTRMQAELIDDLLDISRITAGKLRLEVRPIDLAPVIEAAIEAVRSAAEAKGIEIDLALEAVVGTSGDPDRLQQVVWNLLSNAVKFTPRDGRVEVRLSRVDDAARITVSDTGRGIRPEFLPHIFERFRQADSSTTRAHRGLGLGLSIVRHLVELHGGVVRAESAGEGCGATFTVDLPLTVVHELRVVKQSPGRAGAHREGRFVLAGVRVLVVDDDRNTCDLLRTVLAGEGAAVTTATSVSEAMSALERTLPDVLLSDISMPGEDGYALIHKVRALEPERGGLTPAAALTAYARGEDRRRVLAAGFQVHLAKPTAPTELVEVVAKLARERSEGLTGAGQPATTT